MGICITEYRNRGYLFQSIALEFRPVLQLVDSVTGNSSTYTGPYTLRVLAGGTSRDHMQTFDADENMYAVNVDTIFVRKIFI